MGPIYHSKVELNDVTVYVYDDGFLDPATLIRVRNSPWPTMEDIGRIPDSPSQVHLHMEGTQLIVVAGRQRLTYDLTTKRVVSQ